MNIAKQTLNVIVQWTFYLYYNPRQIAGAGGAKSKIL